jgi:DNA-directed RNA polymerase specialized sigma24 family protein
MGTEKLPERAPSENSTVALIARFKAGDRRVLGTLYTRYLTPFQRWVQCRTPAWARHSIKTETLVEKSLHRSLDERELESSPPSCFQNHLRRKILDGLEDELSHITPHRKAETHSRSSALESGIGRRSCDRYESALKRLSDEDRETIIARIELGFPYSKIAEVLGKSSPEEARQAIIQALLRLAREMGNST